MKLFDMTNLVTQKFFGTLSQLEKGEYDTQNIQYGDLTTKAKLYGGDSVKAIHKIFFSKLMENILNSVKAIDLANRQYGLNVLCFDSRVSWRYKAYKAYKSKRKTKEKDKVYEKLFSVYLVNIIKILKSTNMIVLSDVKIDSTYGLEADDIIAVITQSIDEPHLIVSSDSDFFQLCDQRIQQYSLYHDVLLDTVPVDIRDQMLEDMFILGQDKDSIPSILKHTEFDKPFLTWLTKKHNLELPKQISTKLFNKMVEQYATDIEDFRSIIIAESEEKIKAGQAKRISTKTAFSNKRFGASGLQKIKDGVGINKWIKTNSNYQINYDRNKMLLDLSLDNLPTDVVDIAMTEFEHVKDNRDEFYDSGAVLNKLAGFDIDRNTLSYIS